ncbi:hypothetical protein ACYFX5_20395 [Bremerella sp. T1]|uniref:hypothetical protein n=1 Tax=Bremerella sp. TYQ1 TaxID=3119568 RepID=UPI001CCF10EE|nr:hypothetical protein [Bremerella volcania]UBM35404.1 hypothetical protein LA756_22340 [Bremerella volcania]
MLPYPLALCRTNRMSFSEEEVRRKFFNRLAEVDTPEQREAVLLAAVQAGIDMAELEQWLDWLDNQVPEKQTDQQEILRRFQAQRFGN